MPAARARFATPNASRYLQQLCRHFAHRIEVEYSQAEGRCALPAGPARLGADDAGLDMRVEAAVAQGLARAGHILEDHLGRFAFREDPPPLDWKAEVTQ